MKYFVRSSVFGGEVLSDVNSTGKKLKTYVRANGTVLAWQAVDYATNPATETVLFEHTDASGMTRLMTTKTGGGAIFSEESDADAPMQLDPMGGSVGLQNAYPDDSAPPEIGSCTNCDLSGVPLMYNDDSPRARDGSRMKFAFEGISISWAIASSILESGGGINRRMEDQARQVMGYRISYTKLESARSGRPPVLRHAIKGRSRVPDLGVGNDEAYGYMMVRTPIYNDSFNPNAAMLPAEDQQDRRLTPPEIKKVRDVLSTTLANNKTCKDFLDETLQNLGGAFEGNILAVYDEYANNKRIFDGGGTVAQAPYPAKSDKAELRFGYNFYVSNPQKLAGALFEELLHGAAEDGDSFSHPELALAMFSTNARKELVPDAKLPSRLNPKSSQRDKDVYDGNNWRLIANFLETICGVKVHGYEKK